MVLSYVKPGEVSEILMAYLRVAELRGPEACSATWRKPNVTSHLASAASATIEVSRLC